MNGRRITTKLPGMLRRPLLWAGLCSVILHLPVLALWSYLLGYNEDEPQPEYLLVALLEEAQSEQENVTEPDLIPATAPDIEPVVELPPAPVPQPAAASASRTVAPTSTPSLPPALHLQATTPETAIQAVPATPELMAIAQTTEADSATLLSPPLPARLQMSQQDVSQVEKAMQDLLQRVNEAGLQEGLSTTELSAETLGLPATDAVTAVVVPINDLNDLQQVDITLTRHIDGQAYQLRARLQERALSHYAKFINRWDDDVMLSNDRIDGRFHANSEVNFETSIHARPFFNGEVTIASRQPIAPRLSQSAMFADGILTGTGRISLPREALPAHWLESAAMVLGLDSDTRLEFQGSNGVVWTDLNNNATGRVSVPEAGLIIAGTGRTQFELSGTVAGKVLVYSPRQLVITGDLVYANNSAQSADTLALISEGSIEIARASVTGGGDLEIHGALYARQRFSVRRFRDRYQGTLYVYGALVAGSVSATEPRFNTHIEYDNRFASRRPPAFPTTGLFDLMAWDQHWTATNAADALVAGAADNVPIAVP